MRFTSGSWRNTGAKRAFAIRDFCCRLWHVLCNLLAYSESSPNVATLAASYAFGIVRNHPFVDGNKCVAFVVCRTFLKLNGYDIEASQEEKCLTFVSLAASELSESGLADWIRQRLSSKD